MKEYVYKNFYGNNPRKWEVSIEERNDPVESTRSKKWVCKYYIRERYTANDQKSLHVWINSRKKEGCARNCHILRRVNSQTGENTLICKVLGEFFVVKGLSAYKVLYVNEIRIQCLVPSGRL